MQQHMPVEAAPITASATGPAGLPPKLIEDAAVRLSILAIFLAVVVVIVQVFQRLAQPQLAAIIDDPVNRLVTLAAVLMAAAIVVVQKKRLVPARTLLVFGMAFEIMVAISISMIETAWPFDPDVPLLGL